MDPSTLLILLAVVACPIGMGGMLWMMNKNMAQREDPTKTRQPGSVSTDQRLAELRKRREEIESETAELAKIAELEGRREALSVDPKAARRAAEETTGR